MFPERQDEISDFLWCLQTVSTEMESKKEEAKTILINSEEFYGKQI